MKRFLSICAVVLATVGCANFEEGASLSPTSGAHHTISAVTDLTPLSRVGFERVEGGYKHFWEANDEISLLSASTPNACFALIDGAGGNSAKFSGYADLWHDNSVSGNLILSSEPQFWFNLNALESVDDDFKLSLGGELELSKNLVWPAEGINNKFYAIPTLAAKWKFKMTNL